MAATCSLRLSDGVEYDSKKRYHLKLSRHERTLNAMRRRPLPSNLRWTDIESLLLHLGAVVREGKGSACQALQALRAVKRRRRVITYKGYAGQVDFDPDAEVFGGAVMNANVLMSFEGKNVAALRKSFRDVVDTYLADCKAKGRQPVKPYNGTIIIRVDPEIHRRVALKAAASRKSMNKYVQSVLEKATEDFAARP